MKKNWKLGSFLTGLTLLMPQTLFALSGFSATIDSSNLYYSYSYSGSPTFLRVYIDSDKNAKTGYAVNGIGADYFIENTSVYQFSGSTQSTWSWRSIASSNMVKTSPTVKFQVARSLLGSPTALNALANTSAGDFSAVVAQTLASTTPTSWTFCANENQTCSFSGTQSVRYGAGSSFVTKTMTGPIACSNTTFGSDPAPGVLKHCDISGATTTTTTTMPSSTTTTTMAPTTTTTLPAPSGSTASVSFSANNGFIPNPERGFFMTTDCRASPQGVTQLQNYKAQYGHTVFNCLWYLREFKSSPLTQTVLDQLQAQMNNMRTAGFKMILRLVYTNTDINDAPLSVMQGHLNQIAPLLRNNVDVIATVQTGMIGQWGEMQNSSNFGGPSTSTDWANRKALIDSLLSVVPSSRMIEVRSPSFKMNPYGSTPLSSTEAYSGTARARVGHYNDCFLSSANDWGTYLSSAERTYTEADSKYVSTSGETCALSTYNDCSVAVNSMAAVHWSLLHEGYNADVIAKWKSQGCYPEIKARLGYRYQLQNATLSTSARVGGAINVAFNVANTGFASLYNARPVQLILRNTSTGTVYRLPMNADARRWYAGTTVAVNETLVLPSTIPAGTYAMLLALPDASSSLAARPEYSIQLANAGIWESATGFNKLNLNLVVSP